MIPEKLQSHPDQAWGGFSFAQHGEDFMLANLFNLMNVNKPTWLDLGAHHPTRISNTALLYWRGGRGVNVEANPYLMEEFVKYRPEDKNVNVGVGTAFGTMPFYMYGDDCGRNTFCYGETQKTEQKVQKVIQLTVVPLSYILQRFCGGVWPDLLSTDIEGMDYEVLATADFSKSAPKVIITEALRGTDLPVRQLMLHRGFVLYCRLWGNLVFIRYDLSSQVY